MLFGVVEFVKILVFDGAVVEKYSQSVTLRSLWGAQQKCDGTLDLFQCLLMLPHLRQNCTEVGVGGGHLVKDFRIASDPDVGEYFLLDCPCLLQVEKPGLVLPFSIVSACKVVQGDDLNSVKFFR